MLIIKLTTKINYSSHVFNPISDSTSVRFTFSLNTSIIQLNPTIIVLLNDTTNCSLLINNYGVYKNLIK